MEITQVKIFPVQEEKLKAFVSVVFDQCFMVNDIKVIQGKDGLFLSMPSRRKKSGEFKDVAHPLNNEMRRRLEEKVLDEYRAIVDDATPRRPDRMAPDPPSTPNWPSGPYQAINDQAEALEAKTPPRKTSHDLRSQVRVGADVEAPAAASGFGARLTSSGDASPNGDGHATSAPAPAMSEAATSGAATAGAAMAGADEAARAGEDEDEAGTKTLEEVQEIHLRDSFWNVS